MSGGYIKNQEGFTLVELVVTAVFVAAASAAIIGIFIVTGKLARQSRNLAVATALAEQKIEVYRDAGYAALPTGTPAEDFSGSLPANFGGPKSAVTNVSLPHAGLKQVDVVILYTEDKRPKQVRLTTLIAQRGINR
jgi:type II secretory pathway pseudopilin PulG